MISLRQTIRDIKNDFPRSSFSLKSFFSNYFFSARFRVLLNHRLGKYIFYKNFFLFRKIGLYYRYSMVLKRNCDISYDAVIGKNLRLPHPIGIIIGSGVIIKDNVTIYQQVTVGSHGRKNQSQSYPIIENNVRIYAGAKIIGGITVGENAIIGANAVVNIDVPPNTKAVGIPCRIIS